MRDNLDSLLTIPEYLFMLLLRVVITLHKTMSFEEETNILLIDKPVFIYIE